MKKNDKYYNNLIKLVLEKSDSNCWSTAVQEWEPQYYDEDLTGTSTCVCGHYGIVELNQIVNTINGNKIFPIGSECIKKFSNRELSLKVNFNKFLYKIYNDATSIGDVTQINVNSAYFSREFIEYLYKNKVFENNPLNKFTPEQKYELFKQKFNGKKLTSKQQNVIFLILKYDIWPFVLSWKDNNNP